MSFVFLIYTLITLTGCASPSAIPVVERLQPPSEKINTHWVSDDETLYSIAWRYNLNVDDLASANQLNASNHIYVGQTLRLDVKRAMAKRLQASKKQVRAKTVYSATSGKKTLAERHVNNGVALSKWRWPVEGKVLKRFSFYRSQGHKGMDIKGRQGQSVFATQNGVVVYAGDGLPAYGNLLIVKHPGSYLSAYAHNSRLIVSEGDRVTVGQKVAEVGQSGTTFQHLHFEIRKKGVPVDPLTLLPRV